MSKLPVREKPAVAVDQRWLSALLMIVPLLLASTSGCRSTADNQIDLLERELRVQEDYIYELEDYVVEYSEKLRECRSCAPPQTAVYSEELAAPSSAPKYSEEPAKRTKRQEKSVIEKNNGQPITPPAGDSGPQISPEDLEVPDIDLELDEPVGQLGDESDVQQVEAIDLDDPSMNGNVVLIPDPADFTADDEQYADDDYSDDQFADDDVAHEGLVNEENYDGFADEHYAEEMFDDEAVEQTVALENRVAERLKVRHLFRGEGQTDTPENLLTVIEALDANDEPVDLDGEVSLMVMTADAAQPERLKRWNFTAEETITAWQSSELGDGLHLELPLDKLNLPNTPLELWVRLVGADGRKLLTQLPFEPRQLSDLADNAPEPAASGLQLAEADESVEPPHNSLRIKTKTIPVEERVELTEKKQPETTSRWRSSMQRTDRTSQGFATSTGVSSGWKKQAPGRQPYLPPQLARRPEPTRAQSTSPPTWTSGRSVLPTAGSSSMRR